MKQRIPTPSVVFFRSLMEDAPPEVPLEDMDDGPTVVGPVSLVDHPPTLRPTAWTPIVTQAPTRATSKRRAVSRITVGGGVLVALCSLVLMVAAVSRGRVAASEGETLRFQAAHGTEGTQPPGPPPGPAGSVDAPTSFLFTQPMQIGVTSRPAANGAPPPASAPAKPSAPPPSATVAAAPRPSGGAKPPESTTSVLATALTPKRPTDAPKTPVVGARAGGTADADAARLQQLAAQQLGASLGR